MKRFILLILSAMFLSGQAYASELISNKTLLKKLVEKDILTKEDVKEISHALPKIKLGGRLQVQWKNENGDTEADKVSEFFVRRARFTIKAQVAKWAYMQFQPEFGKNKVGLKDAYIAFTPNKLKIFAGNHYVPFSREALNSSKKLQFVERNLTSQMAPFRQMGLSVAGDGMGKKVSWQAGLWNGVVNSSASSKLSSDKLKKNQIYHINTKENDNSKYMAGGRVEFHPFGYLKKSQENFKKETKLALGASYYASDDTAGGGHTPGTAEFKGTNALELDMEFQWSRLSTLAEFTTRNIDWWQSDDTMVSTAQSSYTVQGSYLIAKKIAMAVRYEFMDYGDGDVMRGSKGQEEDRWTTVGASYYFKKHAMKIQANYIMKDEKMPAGVSKPKNDTMLIQTAYYF